MKRPNGRTQDLPIKNYNDSKKVSVVEEILAAEEERLTGLPAFEIDPHASVDTNIQHAYVAVQYLLARIKKDVQSGNYNRETVTSLKDCLGMLFDLKKREDELLENLSKEELEKILDERK